MINSEPGKAPFV